MTRLGAFFFLINGVAATPLSSSCCEDLGWGAGTYASPIYGVGPTGNVMGFGNPAVCAQSKVGGACSGYVDHFSATEFCNQAGGRLCTADEVLNNDAHGSGCNYDFNWMWTATKCELSCNSDAANADAVDSTKRNTEGYQVLLGFSGSAPQGLHNQSRCLSPIEAQFSFVRCCADSCDIEGATNAVAADELTDVATPVFIPNIPARATDPTLTMACGTGDTDEEVAATASIRTNRSEDVSVTLGKCTCTEGRTVEECGNLGAAVGIQLATLGFCHVVNCGSVGLTSLPVFPATTTKLDLQNNVDLTELPLGALDMLVRTERIYASSVGFTSIPANVFSKMTSLLNLEISISKITTLVSNTFAGLTALTSLMLTANDLWVTVEEGAMDGMDNLTDLLFRSNPKLILPRFDRMPALRKLTVANCAAVRTVPQGVFSQLDVIEEVIFEHNAQMDDISQGAFANAASLQKLDITGSPSLVGLQPRGFEGLDGLLTLSLVACGLVVINDFDFAGLTSLTSMYLGDLEALVSIAPLALSPLTSLRNLRIAKAQLLPALPRLDGLFRDDDGQFSSSDGTSNVGGQLQQPSQTPAAAAAAAASVIEQRSIVVEDLGLTDFSFLDSTTKLYVNRVDVKCMPGIKVVPQNAFRTIADSCSVLKLNGNAVTKIETNAFAGLHKLADLEVRGNTALQWLEPGAFNDAFDHQAESVRIDLQKNGLRVISPETITFTAHTLAAPESTIISVSSAVGTHLDVCCSYEWLALDPHWSLRGLHCNNTRAHESVPLADSTAVAADAVAEGEAESEGITVAIADTAVDVVLVAELDFQFFGCCFRPLGWREHLNAIEMQRLNGLTFGGTKQAGSLRDLSPQVQRHLSSFCANASWGGYSNRLYDSTCWLESRGESEHSITTNISAVSANTVPAEGFSTVADAAAFNDGAASSAAAADASTTSSLEGCPSLDSHFKEIWLPETQECLATRCPEGYRKEYIGKRHLVDCEPWFHIDRAYSTRFVLGETQCIRCLVQHCSVCTDNDFRACSQCIAGRSLLKELNADATSVEYACVERCSDHGRYSLNGECAPLSSCGQREDVEIEATELTDRVCSPQATTTAKTVGAVIGAVLLVSFVALLAFKGYQYRQSMIPFDFETELSRLIASGDFDIQTVVSTTQHILGEENDANKVFVSDRSRLPQEFKRSNVNLVEEIGKGTFGSVYKALLTDDTSLISAKAAKPEYIVAAKVVNDSRLSPEANAELLSESLVMSQLGNHDNVVGLIGVVTRGEPRILIISYCEYGSLLVLLRSRAEMRDPMAVYVKLRLACDVSRGMAHLAQRRFIHRDLAARNVMVSTGMVGKVGDFGLTRGAGTVSQVEGSEDYYRSQNGVFPIRWTSPESMDTAKFTTASDVFSFGITLIEMFQDGIRPYDEMKSEVVMLKVSHGYRHPRPEMCPEAIYNLLLACWATKPEERPKFEDIGAVLEAQLETRARRKSKLQMVAAVSRLGVMKMQTDTAIRRASQGANADGPIHSNGHNADLSYRNRRVGPSIRTSGPKRADSFDNDYASFGDEADFEREYDDEAMGFLESGEENLQPANDESDNVLDAVMPMDGFGFARAPPSSSNTV